MSNSRNLAKLLPNASGELPTANIADTAVSAAKLAATLDLSSKTLSYPDNSVQSADIAALAATKLTQGFSTNGYCDIGNVRIQWVTSTTASSASGGAAPGPGFTVSGILSYPASFKSGTLPMIVASMATEYHDTSHPGISAQDYTNTAFRYLFSCYRAAGLESRRINFIAIGEKP